MTLKKLILFSDGACSGNPGPGGWGATFFEGDIDGESVLLEASSKGYKHTTNNRMELLGVIEPLSALKEKCDVTVITDSQYIANAINQGWLNNWIKKGWKTAGKKPVKNQDLWNKLIHLLNKHKITMRWVRGHDGHIENEVCDILAVKAREGSNLHDDKGYDG